MLRFQPQFPRLLYSLLFSFQGIWNPFLHTRQNIIPNLYCMHWSMAIQVSLDTHWCNWFYAFGIFPMHITEFVLFQPRQHSDLCLENKLQKGTAHTKLMILFGTIDSSSDYSKTKGKDIMPSLHSRKDWSQLVQQHHMSAADCRRAFLFLFFFFSFSPSGIGGVRGTVLVVGVL